MKPALTLSALLALTASAAHAPACQRLSVFHASDCPTCSAVTCSVLPARLRTVTYHQPAPVVPTVTYHQPAPVVPTVTYQAVTVPLAAPVYTVHNHHHHRRALFPRLRALFQRFRR